MAGPMGAVNHGGLRAASFSRFEVKSGSNMVGSAPKVVACQRVGGAQLAQEHRLGY
jgi:hypothetical protein